MFIEPKCFSRMCCYDVTRTASNNGWHLAGFERKLIKNQIEETWKRPSSTLGRKIKPKMVYFPLECLWWNWNSSKKSLRPKSLKRSITCIQTTVTKNLLIRLYILVKIVGFVLRQEVQTISSSYINLPNSIFKSAKGAPVKNWRLLVWCFCAYASRR